MLRADLPPSRAVEVASAAVVALALVLLALAVSVMSSGCASTARPVLEQTSATLQARQGLLAEAYAAELDACLARDLVEDVEACGRAVERQYAAPWAAYEQARAAWVAAEQLDHDGEEAAAIARALEAQGLADRAVAP